MSLYKTEALVLRSRDYGEADSLLTLLTKRRGKVTAIAKGVKKPTSRLRGGVQLFTHNEMLIYGGKSLDIVTQSQCLESFSLLKEDILAMTTASYWSELLDSFIPAGEQELPLFNLALAGYHLLSLEPEEANIRGLEIKLLALLGYKPEFTSCVACGSPLNGQPQISFSALNGGVLCGKCHEAQNTYFSQEALQVWQQLQRMELSKWKRLRISPRTLQILNKTINDFLLQQLDYPLKSRPIMQELLAENRRA